MLDWFSQQRLNDERTADVPLPSLGQILPDYVLQKPDGSLKSLREMRIGCFWLILLPEQLDFGHTYFFEALRRKFGGVRREQTRALVVAQPEHLATVVALGGDLQIVADMSGDAMLELGNGETFTIIAVGPELEVLGVPDDPDFDDQFVLTEMRPAACR